MDERKMTDEALLDLATSVGIPTDCNVSDGLLLKYARAAIDAARRTTPDREAIIDEICLALWDVRRLTGELSSDQIWTIREHFQKLKTFPTSDKGGA